MLSQEDFQDLQKNKKEVVLVNKQWAHLVHKERPFSVVRPATIGDGIHYFPVEEQQYFQDFFERSSNTVSATKFIPASGLASRMFFFLRDFILRFNPENDELKVYLADARNQEFGYFVKHMERFSFYPHLKAEMEKTGRTYANKTEFIVHFVQTLLEDPKLGMEGMAKALLPIFRKQNGYPTAAFELQILEALQLFKAPSKAKVHFTIDAEQLPQFVELERAVLEGLSDEDHERLQIEYSFQDPKTDSVAILSDEDFLRDKDNKLIFRKSGHGALFDNIKLFKDDLLFIKSIDSIWPNDQQSVAIQKAMAGLYLDRFHQLQDLLDLLRDNHTTAVSDALTFIKNNFYVWLKDSLEGLNFKEQCARLISFLNRPLRVCGMIMNEGKPGGGPFWIEQNREVSLQIVESSELQTTQGALDDALFFNPVNMVCGLKNFEGASWNLDLYKDKQRVIISEKQHEGKKIRTFELPGLWNGCMGYWNSIFVEIPTATFRSLKTINDCLEQKNE